MVAGQINNRVIPHIAPLEAKTPIEYNENVPSYQFDVGCHFCVRHFGNANMEGSYAFIQRWDAAIFANIFVELMKITFISFKHNFQDNSDSSFPDLIACQNVVTTMSSFQMYFPIEQPLKNETLFEFYTLTAFETIKFRLSFDVLLGESQTERFDFGEYYLDIVSYYGL